MSETPAMRLGRPKKPLRYEEVLWPEKRRPPKRARRGRGAAGASVEASAASPTLVTPLGTCRKRWAFANADTKVMVPRPWRAVGGSLLLSEVFAFNGAGHWLSAPGLFLAPLPKIE